MPIDPKDYFFNVIPGFDLGKLATTVSSGITFAQTDPLKGLGVVVDAGGVMQTLFSSNAVAALSTTPRVYEALTNFTKPYTALSNIAAGIQFPATLNALASVGNLGIGVNNLYATNFNLPNTSIVAGSLASSVLGETPAKGYAAISGLTAPYLASAASVFSLESSYASANVAFAKGLATTIQPSYVSSLQTNIATMSSALQSTWEGINRQPQLYGSVSIDWLRSPAIEVYTAAHAAAAVSLPTTEQPDVDTEIEEALRESDEAFEARLASLDPSLVVTYRGGLVAVERGDDDWQRHAMVSFRELSTHALHLLAPDAKIIPNANPADLHNGRPTRRARLNFIFSSISNSAVASFYEADMSAAIALFELLNDGTHRLKGRTTPEQVHYLRSRIVGLLTSMLEAGGY